MSKNRGVVKAFEDALGMEVLVDPDGHLMGAFGAALLAAEAVPPMQTAGVEASDGAAGGGNAHGGAVREQDAFDFDAMERFAFTTREVECNKCANHCEIICVYRDDQLIDSWGNRCDQEAVRAG